MVHHFNGKAGLGILPGRLSSLAAGVAAHRLAGRGPVGPLLRCCRSEVKEILRFSGAVEHTIHL